jgi:hypothetical protein
MTHLEALTALRDKVKAGEPYETMGHTQMCQRAFPKPDNFDGSREAYAKSDAQMAILAWRNDDLNAAKALHEAVLAGWSTEIICRPFGISPHQWHIRLSTDSTGWGNGKSCSASNETPARAWLLAILEALIAQETDK